ncbi:unnamed protein product [Parnassius apollo]|uniref:Transmembrane protein 231 n=1 Tax=Parnassius apollo TaxID=110799 RepID=A0A8S3X5H4_PARAO|nr:unnamed protein product [Parnassius apollo]
MNIILPFIVAYRGRGFWLKTHSFYEQPVIRSTFDYIFLAKTIDPSQVIICGDAGIGLNAEFLNDENCAEIEIQENDYNADGKTDMLHFKLHLNVLPNNSIISVLLILGMDFQLQTTCELHMQTLAVVDKEFTSPSSGLYYYGDLQFYQSSHLPCINNVIDTTYNTSLFTSPNEMQKDVIDFILEDYFRRKVTTQVKTLFAKVQNGYTGTLDVNIHLRVPEMHIRYQPSVMQELKWAWPQYFSLVAVFYWIFNRVKRFVFNKRLLMAWEIVPWKKNKLR